MTELNKHIRQLRQFSSSWKSPYMDIIFATASMNSRLPKM